MFYGWVIVGAAFITICLTNVLQQAYGVLLPYVEQELNTSRMELSAPYSLFIFVYSILSYPAGVLTDRVGPRLIVAAGGIVLGGGFAYLSQANQPWEILVLFGLAAAVGKCVAFVPPQVTVSRWFNRKRGLAMGIASSGANVAILVAPPLTAALVMGIGWRQTCVVLGAICAVSLCLAGWAMFRDPELRGLKPDGVSAAPQNLETDTRDAADWTAAAARRTAAFWIVMGVFGFAWVMLFFPFAHLPALAKDLGMAPTAGAVLITCIGIGGLVGRPLLGAFSDRVGLRAVLIVALLLQAAGFGAFALAAHSSTLFYAAVIFGFGSSAIVGLFSPLIVDLFGRSHVGAISGVLFAVTSIISAAGPSIAGFSRDLTGDYAMAFAIGVVCSVVGALLVATLRRPKATQPPEPQPT